MSESLSMLAKLVEGQLVIPDALDFQEHIAITEFGQKPSCSCYCSGRHWDAGSTND